MKNAASRYLFPIGLAGLSACAAAPQPPNDALQAAEIAIANAQGDHAADFAPLEMQSALEKMTAAHEDAQQPDETRMILARRLADEAQVDAELASARTKLVKADTVNADLQKSSDTLRLELQRGSGI